MIEVKINPHNVLPWPLPVIGQLWSTEDMATKLIDRIKAVRPNGPCAIAEYSSGGFLAIEITKQFRNNGYPVSFLGVIDTYPIFTASFSEVKTFLAYVVGHALVKCQMFTFPSS